MIDNIEGALKEEMQKDNEKQKVKSNIFLKVELLEAIQKDIANFIKKVKN